MSSLTKQKPGYQGTISNLSGDPVILERLREFGFIIGQHITLQETVPFSGPLIVKVNNITVALRRVEADCIFIL